MRSLRLFLVALVVIALAMAAIFALALKKIATSGSVDPDSIPQAILGGFSLFLLLLVPIGALYAWSNTHATLLDTMSRMIREEFHDDAPVSFPSQLLEGEIGDLARSVEELRRELARQLDSAEQRRRVLTQILDAIGEGVVAIAADGRVVLANARSLEMLGVVQGLSEGATYLQLLRSRSLADAFDLAMAGEASVVRTTVSPRVRRELEVKVFPVEGSADVAVAALLLDVTDLTRLEKIRRDFVDDFSHEVRTPLAGVRSAAESLAGGGLRPEQEEQLRAIVLRQVTRLEKLVQNISELSEIESKAFVLQRQPVELLRLAEEIGDEYRDRMGDDGSVSVRGQPVTVEADPIKIQQILSNLLENALRHSGSRRIEISVDDEGDDAVFRVRDYGDGIILEEQERIFHRFYRVDRSRSGKGSGLGLAITKHLVLRHGGGISVQSAPGEGATFIVRLPKTASRVAE